MAQVNSYKSAISLKKESTWGTDPTVNVMMPVNEFSSSPTYEVIRDSGMRGVGARDFDSIQGAGRGEFTMGGLVYCDEIGHLLLAMMGSVSVSGSTVFTHTFVQGDTPGSLTVEEDVSDAAANLALQFTGARAGELGFSFDAGTGVLEFTSSWMSKIPTKVTGASPAVSGTLTEPWGGWRGTVASSGLTSIIVSADFTLSRELQPVYTAQNSQEPFAIMQGPLSFEGRLVLAAEDLTEFDTWKAHTEQSFVIAFTTGSGDARNSFQITATVLNLANGPFEIDRSAAGVVFGLPVLGLWNSTDAGPVQIELINSVAAY
tara:strand:+ start:429 stop:1379 length:951 start_codon:yes stop_codon:yes gene_type:complete